MSKKEKTREKNLSLLIVAVLLLSIFIIAIEVVSVNRENRKEEEKLSENEMSKTEPPTTTKDSFYDTSNLTFTQLDLKTPVQLTNTCINGCNLKIVGNSIMLIIKKNSETGEYHLDLVNDKKSIFENKLLGTSLEGSSLSNYGEYKVLKVKIKNNEYFYDYALFIDVNGAFDEISSLNANEMEFLENGVVYYYDVCSSDTPGVGKKVKAVRAPFSDKPAIISSTPASFSWCE